MTVCPARSGDSLLLPTKTPNGDSKTHDRGAHHHQPRGRLRPPRAVHAISHRPNRPPPIELAPAAMPVAATWEIRRRAPTRRRPSPTAASTIAAMPRVAPALPPDRRPASARTPRSDRHSATAMRGEADPCCRSTAHAKYHDDRGGVDQRELEQADQHGGERFWPAMKFRPAERRRAQPLPYCRARASATAPSPASMPASKMNCVVMPANECA